MKPNVTDFYMIQGAFETLPKDQQDELTSCALALVAEADVYPKAYKKALHYAAAEWMISVFNDMDDKDWEEMKQNGYDLDFLMELKNNAMQSAPDGYLSEWENIIYVYAFRKGMEARD